MDRYPEVGQLDHSVVLPFIFCGTAILFSTVATPVCISTPSAQGFLFSTSSPTPVISCLFDDGRWDRWEVVSHCGFHVRFPDVEGHRASFHVPIGHLWVFVGKMPMQIFCPF